MKESIKGFLAIISGITVAFVLIVLMLLCSCSLIINQTDGDSPIEQDQNVSPKIQIPPTLAKGDAIC